MNTFGLVGDIPDDPRVKEAMDRVEGKNIETHAAEALTPKTLSIEEQYGVKMRPQNLMQGVIISRIMALGTVDQEYQPWIWLWSLCAPISEIYRTIDEAKKEGVPHLMAKVHEWFTSSKLPQDVTKELMEVIAHTFVLASQLSPQTGDSENTGLKKNATLGG